MKRHINGYIVEGVDIIDIDLWRRRLKKDRLYYEKLKRILTNSLESTQQKLKALEAQRNGCSFTKEEQE